MNSHRRILAAVCAAAALATPSARAFTFDDIHYWVGEGDNKIAIVLDWDGTAKAWGFKWSGDAPTLGAALRAIVEEDNRLVMHEAYGMIDFFGYDLNDTAARFDAASGTSSDAGALAAVQMALYMPDHPYAWGGYVYKYWSIVKNTASAYSTTDHTWANGVDNETAVGGTWYSLTYCIDPVLHTPTAAETPYGFSVVKCVTSASAPYKDPSVVLGRPTDTIYDAWSGGTCVISPACPPWGEGTVLTLETKTDNPAYVTIAFDHDVIDDPANPFGVDFIVFGNSGINCQSGYFDNDTDPTSTICAGVSSSYGSWEEPGLVEVSQDGKTWYTCTGYADTSSLPTLSRLYDPENPDTTLYDGNKYWGGKTDPRMPVDPSITWEDCTGLTFADLCRRYNGSAGGRGFDISALPLATNADGRKWFRYVRISSITLENDEGDFLPTTPEVDAVADVAPVSGYRNWVCANFTWDKAWRRDLTAETAIAPNGLANGLNCAYGLKPTDAVAVDVPFAVESFTPGETEHVITMRSPKELSDTPTGLIVKAASGLERNAAWTTVRPALRASEAQADGAWLNTFTVPASAGAFFRLAVDAE